MVCGGDLTLYLLSHLDKCSALPALQGAVLGAPQGAVLGVHTNSHVCPETTLSHTLGHTGALCPGCSSSPPCCPLPSLDQEAELGSTRRSPGLFLVFALGLCLCGFSLSWTGLGLGCGWGKGAGIGALGLNWGSGCWGWATGTGLGRAKGLAFWTTLGGPHGLS